MEIKKTGDYNVALYQLQKQAVQLDANNLLLINDPSDELLGMAFMSHFSKVINGENVLYDRQCAKYLDEYISKILTDDKYIENLINETIENNNEKERLKCRKHSYCNIS